jgi:hypothetical protein
LHFSVSVDLVENQMQVERRPFTWKRFSDWLGKWLAPDTFGFSWRDWAIRQRNWPCRLSARTARPKENENHFYFTPISICSATLTI